MQLHLLRSEAFWKLVVVSLALFLRWLFGTISGVLVLTISLYVVLWFGEVTKPLTAHQLILWVDSLSSNTKIAIATSILTVAGFLIAFYTATKNWKDQARAQLKIEAASDLQQFFTESQQIANRMQFYAQLLVQTISELNAKGRTEQTLAGVLLAAHNSQQFLADQTRFATLAVEVHQLSGKHGYLLSTVPGATSRLQRATKIIEDVANVMWIGLPVVVANVKSVMTDFAPHVNVEKSDRLARACKRVQSVGTIIGEVRGQLLSPIIDFNLIAIITMLTNRNMRAAFRRTYVDRLMDPPKDG